MNLPVKYSLLSPSERRAVRERYRLLQNDRCMYCNNLLTEQPPEPITKKWIDWSLFPPNFLKWPVHLQHNHKTDMTEGAVHSYCNAVLWLYEGR